MNQMQHGRNQVLKRIENACALVHRSPEEVHLLAVSKKQSSDAIRESYALGQHSFGENYLQEALDKMAQLHDLTIEWHFIGHVQRNKTKHLAENFDWIHGVDRLIIAKRLSEQRPVSQAPINLCIQVNIDHQDSKDGCLPEDVAELVAQISLLSNIRLRGLMIIPAPEHSEAFFLAKQLFEQVKSFHAKPDDWDTLSMGMSADLEPAIAAGASIVRVGTALFGARD